MRGAGQSALQKALLTAIRQLAPHGVAELDGVLVSLVLQRVDDLGKKWFESHL